MTFAVMTRLYSLWARGKRISETGAANQAVERGRGYRVLTVFALLLAASGCHPTVARNDESLPIFDGVTTQFTLTRSRIRKDQPLEVRVTMRNTTDTVKVFRSLDVDIDARLYSNGQLLEDRCDRSLDFPLKVMTLKPGEVAGGTTKVHTPGCYNLAPGKYSIRFNYNLRALEDDSLRTEYEKEYGHPKGGIVPWDGRDHPFTVIE